MSVADRMTRAAAAVVATAVLFGLVMAPSARAAGGDGVAVAAQALRSARLYVDPDMTWIFPPAAEKQLETELRASTVPVFVVAVPFNIDEDFSDYASYYLQQLYQRLQKHGVYLAVSPSGNIYDAEYYVSRDISLPFSVEEENYAFDRPDQIAGSTASRVIKLVQLIAVAPADSTAAVAAQPLYTPGEFATQASGSGALSDDGGGGESGAAIAAGIASFLLLGPFLVLVGYGLVRLGRRMTANRRGQGDSEDPGSPIGHMPASPSTGWLVRHARGELAALEQLISARGTNNPGWQWACDAYDAGMLTVDSEPEQIDLVGAIVLARDGRLALKWRTGRPPAPCLVNPLHGRSTTVITGNSISLQPLIQRLHLIEVPACAGCARSGRSAPRGNLSPLVSRVLMVEHNGGRGLYFSFDSVWRDAKFGASGQNLPQAVREHLGVR